MMMNFQRAQEQSRLRPNSSFLIDCSVRLVFVCDGMYLDYIVVAFLLYREIIQTMVTAYSQKFFNCQKPVFDGRKNLYSKDPLPIGRDKVL